MVGMTKYRSAGIAGADLPFGRRAMAWKKPVVTEVCVAMEINGYMPIEF
ncbi:pyrroloquinoline quinone precursor peptide PqqA [Aurantimonas sp. Leaf443]|nr:pyrroloquinoline quinone precursor peptide PqqA [Aurantimonas sp. Leaf443]